MALQGCRARPGGHCPAGCGKLGLVNGRARPCVDLGPQAGLAG